MSTNGRSNGKLHLAADPDALVDADQTVADADQTASDSDQSASDLDHSASEADHRSSQSDGALSEADQGAADSDQQLADRELARGDHSDAEERAHDASRFKRAQNTAERGATAWLRNEAATERFETAVRRDETARLRDLAAEARDRAAAVRDRLAPNEAADARARAQAAADRRRAAKDRERAAADRRQAALDREEARQALLETQFDELTGTYRRGMGDIVLQGEISRASRADNRLVLAFVDVDRLKELNDSEGHSAGDALLRDVAATIRSKLRSYDPVVRFGGDEFVCTIADADLDDARLRFDEIGQALSRVREGSSISVGFARLEPGDTLKDLTERADASLYEAKRPSRDAAAAARGETT